MSEFLSRVARYKRHTCGAKGWVPEYGGREMWRGEGWCEACRWVPAGEIG